MPPRSRDWTLQILEAEKGGSDVEKSVNSGTSTPASKKGQSSPAEPLLTFGHRQSLK